MGEALNKTVAIEKGVKQRVERATTDLYHAAQKPDLFNGFIKNYEPKDEGGEQYPPEQKVVQLRSGDVLSEIGDTLGQLFDVEATKDYGNMMASADIKVGDKVLVTQAPIPFILFLEKQVNDIRSVVTKLPILDPAATWDWDETAQLHKTEALSTHRTKKVPKPITLAPATKEHPAQVQMHQEDLIVGHWKTAKHSGAVPLRAKKEMLARVDQLGSAIKEAREEANSVEIEKKRVSKKIFEYLFSTNGAK